MKISQKKLKTIQYSDEELAKYARMYHYRIGFNSWQIISQYQTLSEDFIKEFQNELCLHTVAKYQKISPFFAVSLEMFEHISDFLENKNISEEEKQGIVTALKLLKC